MLNWILVFLTALIPNIIWENLHRLLYVHYKHGPITQLILLRAALVDAAIITVLFAGELWLMVAGGLLIAIALEKWALTTGRWAYTARMPIIPFIRTGLTPTVQLALTGLITYLVTHAIPIVAKYI